MEAGRPSWLKSREVPEWVLLSKDKREITKEEAALI